MKKLKYAVSRQAASLKEVLDVIGHLGFMEVWRDGTHIGHPDLACELDSYGTLMVVGWRPCYDDEAVCFRDWRVALMRALTTGGVAFERPFEAGILRMNLLALPEFANFK